MIKNNLLVFQFLLTLTFLLPDAYSYELNIFNDIEVLTSTCLNKSSSRSCREAIDLVHQLQLNSERSMNFPCQTRLLGLEANLIMSMNNSKKINKTYQIIKQVKKLCESE